MSHINSNAEVARLRDALTDLDNALATHDVPEQPTVGQMRQIISAALSASGANAAEHEAEIERLRVRLEAAAAKFEELEMPLDAAFCREELSGDESYDDYPDPMAREEGET
jgi:hypothetical protein